MNSRPPLFFGGVDFVHATSTGVGRRHAGCLLAVVLVMLPSSSRGASRVFLAPLGAQDTVAPTGNTTVLMPAGTTLALNVWMSAPFQGQVLTSYQLVLKTHAKGGTQGSVSYVDTNPGEGDGGSIVIDSTRPDWIFNYFYPDWVIDPVYVEHPKVGLFGVVQNAFYCDSKTGNCLPGTIGYMAELHISASADARGTFEFQWNFWEEASPGTALFSSGGAQFDPNAVFDNLTVIVPACGDGVVQGPIEGCDDANTHGGDGCSASCAVESGYVCAGAPSLCLVQPGLPAVSTNMQALLMVILAIALVCLAVYSRKNE